MQLRIDATPGAAENILALYGAGMTATAVSAVTGWSATGIRRWLRRNGRARPTRMSAAVKREIERLYLDGMSIEAVGKAVGYTHGAVRYYLRSRDMYVPERVHVTADMREKIRDWYYRRGVPVAVICDRLGVKTIYGHVDPYRRRR